MAQTRIFWLKTAKSAGGWRYMCNEEILNMSFLEHYKDNQIKEYKVGKECRTWGRHKICTQNFGRKPADTRLYKI